MPDTNNILFDGYHLVSFQMYHLLLLVQVLLVMLEELVYEIMFWGSFRELFRI